MAVGGQAIWWRENSLTALLKDTENQSKFVQRGMLLSTSDLSDYAGAGA